MLGLAALTLFGAGSSARDVVRPTAASRLPAAPRQEGSVGAAFERLPLVFVPNAGQSEARVRFLAQVGGVSFFFTRGEAVLAFARGERGQALALRFLDANPAVQVVGRRRGLGRVSYLRGTDPRAWRSGLPTFAELVYRELWPGIDLAFSGAAGELKYELRLRPGADPGRIRLAYAGAEQLSLTKAGALAIATRLGTLADSRPRSYQPFGGEHEPVRSGFMLRGSGSFGFRLGGYDRGEPLVIDPGLAYSTFLGGSEAEFGAAIALDRAGNAYLTGGSSSFDFPTTLGAFDRSFNGFADAFVSKLNAQGSALVYSTYLGGASDDAGWAIAVDRDGSAFVTGNTDSFNFPTSPGGYDRSYNGGGNDAFLSKLNPDGSALVYSTYLGGGDIDQGKAIALDRAGRAYLSGFTGSGFPTTPSAYDETCGPTQDAFVSKLNAAGSKLAYSTCLGGSQGELVGGIAVDRSGNAYLTGWTASPEFPTTRGAFDRSFTGSSDAYVTKLNGAGTKLAYSTFLGGSSGEAAQGIALDRGRSAYVTGLTASADFPTTPDAFDTSFNGTGEFPPADAFVTKLNPAGSGLVYSSYLGGSGSDEGNAIAINRAGEAYLAGQTGSITFPTTANAFDRSRNGSGDAFVTRLNTAGSDLLYSSYLGGSSISAEDGTGIAVDQAGNAYVTGGTSSGDFPTTQGAYDRSCGGCPNVGDGFVTKLPT
jgi:hypothetical protein